MDCPGCTDRPLTPGKIMPGLPGMTCRNCQGVLLDLLAFRLWVEQASLTDETASGRVVPDDSRHLLVCPRCERMMTKYRITSEIDNRLDLCGQCGALWMDGGEWELLAAHDLLAVLPGIFSDAWQFSVKAKSVSALIEDGFQQQFGDSDYERIKSIREWLSRHPKKEQLLHYLMRQ